jgi:hypothetical protein
MTLQNSVAVRGAKLDAVETQIGTTAVLKIFSGAQPANCAAADPSGLLVNDIAVGLDGGGWPPAPRPNWAHGRRGIGSGTAASWRIYASDGTTCGMQGNTTDMTFDNVTSRQVRL